MKQVNTVLTVILLVVLTGCGRNKQSNDDLIIVDVSKSYPKKELILQDFMNVEYVALETTDEFLTQGLVQDVGKEYLLVTNRNNDGDIFIFDRQTGKGLKKINRRGQGAEEYARINEIILDESNDEKLEHYTEIQLSKLTAPNGKSNLSVYVYVPENLDNFKKDVTLRNRKTKEEYELTDAGAAVSEKTAGLLDLKVGDELTVKKDDREYQVKIAVITENYAGHYVYMTPNVYKETFGEDPDYADIVFAVRDEYKDQTESIGQKIMESPAVLSISYTASTMDMVNRMLSTLGIVIIVLIVSAGMLAFVVLYNLNNINIMERQRELATLKVLGFFDGEVSQYVLRENIILTIAGILFGAVFGILLHRYIIVTVEVDAVMFGRNIRPISFVYCAVITCIFSIIVNIFMHRKLKKIDMVESLKSVE